MTHAVQHNLPIFSKREVLPLNGKFYINASIGFETYLGVMNTSPRRDYFAFIDKYNGRNGEFKIGRLDLMDVTKKVKKNSVLLEVVPNTLSKNIDFNKVSEFVPRMKSGYLVFSTEEVKMSFFDWIKFTK